MPTLVHPILALALLVSAQFIIAADYNIVYVALPSIGNALGFSSQNLQWVISSYALAFGGFLLLGGRLGDIIGRRRSFILALMLYAVSSLSGGFATSPAMLVVSRAVQGLGGALLLPTTLSLLTTYYAEGPVRNRALGWLGAAGASGGALGTLLGGLLTSTLGWNWTFFVNIPVAAMAVASAFVLLPRDVPASARRGVDGPGALTATAGVTLLVLACVEGPQIGWATGPVLTMLVFSAAFLVGFVGIEARSQAPLMPLRLFRHPTLPPALIVTALFMSAFGAQYYLLTTYLQAVRHYPPATAGLAFLPFSLSIVLGTRIAGKLVAAIGLRRGLLTGFGFGIAGLLTVGMSLSQDGAYLTHMIPGFLLDGVGQGITWTLMWIAATSGIDASDRGIASGMASTAQWVGNALGLALLVAVAARFGLGADGSTANMIVGLRAAFMAAAGVAMIACCMVIGFVGRSRTSIVRPPISGAVR